MLNKKEWLEKIEVEKKNSMPILTFPAIQLFGITVKQLVSSSDLQAKVMAAIAEKYPVSAVLSMMDLSVEAEEFGATVRFFDMDVPTVTGRVINDMDAAKKLMVPLLGGKRTLQYVEGIRKAKALIPDKPIFAGVIGPFSLAGRLMDMTEIMVNCYLEPEMVHITLEKATEFIIKYIKAFKLAGADGVVMAEPAAGLLSPEICEEFSSRYIRRIVKETADDKFVFVYHNCGNTIPLHETIASINADIYHFGDAIDLEEMLKVFPADKLVMGNISPARVIRNLEPKKIKEEVTNLLKRCSKYENFSISTGCDIPPMTPLENIEAYFSAISEYYDKHQ
ncbi:MAG TPA: uroporphyrinogen decarboxylase family protein [Bacillota bacterium]|nr:uroporphyrinogen decarboxylase family protein [Bacillota bacterium]